MSTLGNEYFIVGSTEFQIAVYSHSLQEDKTAKLVKMLSGKNKLSIYDVAFSQRIMVLAVACDGGLIQFFEMVNFEKIGQLKAQLTDVTSIVFVRPNVLVAAQIKGYFDIVNV